jgi:predicted XRE-type DNA-binding protein
VSNEIFSSVWDAIEGTPEQAQNMKLRSILMMAPKDHIIRSGISQAETARHFCVTQPRVSDLMRGKISLLALDTRVNMAANVRNETRASDTLAKRGTPHLSSARDRTFSSGKFISRAAPAAK